MWFSRAERPSELFENMNGKLGSKLQTRSERPYYLGDFIVDISNIDVRTSSARKIKNHQQNKAPCFTWPELALSLSIRIDRFQIWYNANL